MSVPSSELLPLPPLSLASASPPPLEQKGAQHSLAGEGAGGANSDQIPFIYLSQTLMFQKITEFEPLLTGERKTYINLYKSNLFLVLNALKRLQNKC